MPSYTLSCILRRLCVKVFIKSKVPKYFLGAGRQVMLCCVQHDFFERPFNQQLRGDRPYLIEISDEVSYVITVTSFLCETSRPVLASIFHSAFEEDLRIAHQKKLDRI